MHAGDITIDGIAVGVIEINLPDTAEHLMPYVSEPKSFGDDGYTPSGGTKEHGVRLGHKHGFRHQQPAAETETIRLGHKRGFHHEQSTGDHEKTSGTRANYMHGQHGGIGENITGVTTAGGHKFSANRVSASHLKGFVEDLEAAGAPISSIGGYNPRKIAGSGRWSQHAYGNAIDIDQHSRGVVSKPFGDWAKSHPAELSKALQKHGIKSGGDFGDFGHFEWGGGGSTDSKTAPPTDGVRGSWFDDRSTASGVSAATTPGIALPSREGLGKMHEVTGPSGQKVLLPQIDVGPAKWTKRGIDISAPALKELGYTKDNFPTDAIFKHRPVESIKPQSSIAAPYQTASSQSPETGTNPAVEQRKFDAPPQLPKHGRYPPTEDEFRKKYHRDPTTDQELEYYHPDPDAVKQGPKNAPNQGPTIHGPVKPMEGPRPPTPGDNRDPQFSIPSDYDIG